jgi:hypothetical protein
MPDRHADFFFNLVDRQLHPGRKTLDRALRTPDFLKCRREIPRFTSC